MSLKALTVTGIPWKKRDQINEYEWVCIIVYDGDIVYY
jgi:hypothetical protein